MVIEAPEYPEHVKELAMQAFSHMTDIRLDSLGALEPFEIRMNPADCEDVGKFGKILWGKPIRSDSSVQVGTVVVNAQRVGTTPRPAPDS
jgi:hypothetical protein